MKIKQVNTKLIKWADLSEAIRDEIGSEAINGTLFWVKSPTTLKEIEAQPLWFNLCRENDFVPGENLLVEVYW